MMKRGGKAASPKLSQATAPVRKVPYVTSPLLASRTPVWRARLVLGGLGLGFCVLVGRAAYIQIFANDFYLKQGAVRYEHRMELPASRGRILDRNGLLLASSVPAASFFAIPKDMDADAATLHQLARLLDMSTGELRHHLKSNPNFVWLARQVPDEVADRITSLNLKGVHQLKELRRVYPEGEAAAQVVGFTNVEDRGQEGVELAFQDQLAGRDGLRHVIKDRLGNVVEDAGDKVPAVDGKDVQLTLDSRVQFFAYQRVRDAVRENHAKSGSVVVLDAHTGDILALANYPSYNPDDRSTLHGSALRNHALTDTFEPGSTMKPLVIGLALETGRVTPNTMIDTGDGRINVNGAIISDDHANGVISVAQVVQKSSNVGAVKVALQMQPREMWELFSSVGFGQKPQLPFPGLASGRLRPYRSWRVVDQATMSYGYGLSVSVLQLARAYTVFANGGVLMPVSLLRGATPVGDSAAGVRIFSANTAAEVCKMLQMVTSTGGTAPKAQTVGYSVGGKTGTAYKQVGRHYDHDRYGSWFVGLAPLEHPRIVVAVMIDDPSAGLHFGGDVAAPVFSSIVEKTLSTMGVAPDLTVQPQIVAQQSVARPTATPEVN